MKNEDTATVWVANIAGSRFKLTEVVARRTPVMIVAPTRHDTVEMRNSWTSAFSTSKRIPLPKTPTQVVALSYRHIYYSFDRKKLLWSVYDKIKYLIAEHERKGVQLINVRDGILAVMEEKSVPVLEASAKAEEG